MFRNYFKIAWRTLLRNRSFTILNVSGLSVGVAAALLLFLAVRYELSFDTFHAGHDRIYRVAMKQVYPNGIEELTAGNPLPVAAALKTDIPQFEKIVPVFGRLEPQVTVLGSKPDDTNSPTKYLEDDEGMMVGPEFFQLFNFRWLVGKPDVLAQPNVVVLSERFAQKYFGDPQQAVGKFLRINNQVTMRVAGVLANAPTNTDFPLNLIISYATKQADKRGLFGFGAFDDWGSNTSNDQVFVRLPANFSEQSANALLNKFSRKHYDGRGGNTKQTHFLSPLADVHHNEQFENYSDRTVPYQRIWNMATVCGLLLLMACINFINISSALATKRAKEVGVRKVLGSRRSQLVVQFLAETFLVVLVSLMLGFGLAYLALPLLNDLFDIPGEASLFFGTDLVGLTLPGLLVGLTILSGLYPALVLSSFSPLDVFRKRVGRGRLRGITLRQTLIVVQFASALVLIISTIINLQQMRHLSRLDVGFAKEGVYNFTIDPEHRTRFATLRNELLRVPGITAVTFASDPPSSANKWRSNFAFTNLSKDEDFQVSMKMADGDYIKTFGIKLLAGATYSATDTLNKFIVNETLLKKLGVRNPASVIGKQLRIGGGEPASIVGVVQDFHTNSAREGVQPLVLTPFHRYYFGGSVKMRVANLPQTVDRIKAVYAKLFPEAAFSGRFYEESLQNYYKAEQQMGLIYRVFAGLTIFIACLGLFGLAAFSAEQRTKEIGVRKVLGASVASIVTLLSKDFLKLVCIAFVIAVPIAWYAMNRWLQDFAYRIDIAWWVFALAGIIALLIALVTVSFQAIKAALANPVKSLRSE